MSEKTADMIMAGDVVFAGTDEGETSEVSLAIVLQFESEEALKEAIKAGQVSFTVFGS